MICETCKHFDDPYSEYCSFCDDYHSEYVADVADEPNPAERDETTSIGKLKQITKRRRDSYK